MGFGYDIEGGSAAIMLGCLVLSLPLLLLCLTILDSIAAFSSLLWSVKLKTHAPLVKKGFRMCHFPDAPIIVALPLLVTGLSGSSLLTVVKLWA